MKFSKFQVDKHVLTVVVWLLSISTTTAQGLQIGDPIISVEVKPIQQIVLA